eukprot:scaffold80775_cov19-Tisochrysis_lutea.AAC.1
MRSVHTCRGGLDATAQAAGAGSLLQGCRGCEGASQEALGHGTPGWAPGAFYRQHHVFTTLEICKNSA